MAFGTAGLTAMLSVLALVEPGMTPESGREVLVTGASGAVGSYAIAFLHRRGYKVAALSHRKSNRDYLTRAGRRDLLTGFGLYLIRAVLNGRGDEAIDLAKTNLFR
jgi:acrylyl-CoA reductase (NADPH)